VIRAFPTINLADRPDRLTVELPPGCGREHLRKLVASLPTMGKPPRPARKPRKPTLVSVAKQASKAAIPVARYEVKPDGTVVVVTGTPEPAASDDPWPLDEFRTKETKQ
jgi:hypothetical protein